MKKISIMVVLLMLVSFGNAFALTEYYDQLDWETGMGWPLSAPQPTTLVHADFYSYTTGNLVPDYETANYTLAFSTTNGSIDTLAGKWVDNVIAGGAETIFTFPDPLDPGKNLAMNGFGGIFTLSRAQYGGGLNFIIQTSGGPVQANAATLTYDTFYGFISDVPFTSVTIKGASATQEIFDLEYLGYGTSVPEPSTLILLGAGALGMAFWRRRSLNG